MAQTLGVLGPRLRVVRVAAVASLMPGTAFVDWFRSQLGIMRFVQVEQK
ncbi:hypothetical protein ACH4PW_35140 [Streptomyces sp. NPDC017082]